jgi:AAA family ATP:ADP antiporter
MSGDLFRSLLAPVVRIKREEWPKTFLMFLYFFFTITSYYILKPVRDSVFIDKYGAENLPYIWLVTIVVLSLIVSIYVKFVDILAKNVLLSSTVIFFVSNLVAFWWLSHFDYKWLAAVFFVWVSIFSVMMVTQFWLYANDLFNPREAKRLFGFVGSGGILGGITGGLITNALATVVGSRNLLLVAALILLFCALLINVIWELERTKSLQDFREEKPSHRERKETSRVLSLIWKKRYLFLLLGLVCVAKIVSTLVDYQFKNIVQEEIIGRDVRTAFFGKFFAWLNTVSFVVQFFLTSYVLRRFGVGMALCLLPFGLSFGSCAILAHPALWSSAFTMLYDGSVNYSLNQSTKEMLYLPVVRHVRYRVKPFIDMVGYRVAKGIGSVLILLFVNMLHFDVRSLSIVALALIGFWFVMIRIMRSEYVNALREFLRDDLPRTHEAVVPQSEDWLLYAVVTRGAKASEGDVRLAMRLYQLGGDSSFLSYLALELGNPIEEVRKKLATFVESGEANDLHREIGNVLRHSSLQDAASAVRFFTEFDPRTPEILRPYLESGNGSLAVAAACGMILFDSNQDVAFLAKKIIEANKKAKSMPLSAGEGETQAPEHGQAREWVLSHLRKLAEEPAKEEEILRAFGRSSLGRELLSASLASLIDQAEFPVPLRRKIPLLLSGIRNANALILLYRMISDRDMTARDAAINALVEIRIQSPETLVDEARITREIEDEIADGLTVHRLIRASRRMSRGGQHTPEGTEPFVRAQEFRFREGFARIFMLLSLLAEPQDIRTVYHSLKHPSELIKANALELLENVLDPPKLKQRLFQLIETEFAAREPGDSTTSRGSEEMPEEDEPWIEESLQKEDPWCLLSIVFLVLSFQLNHFYTRLCVLSASRNPFVRELATVATKHLEARHGSRERSPSL